MTLSRPGAHVHYVHFTQSLSRGSGSIYCEEVALSPKNVGKQKLKFDGGYGCWGNNQGYGPNSVNAIIEVCAQYWNGLEPVELNCDVEATSHDGGGGFEFTTGCTKGYYYNTWV